MAQKDPKWFSIMHEEYQALIQSHTWDLVLSCSMQNTIGYKWIYKIKQQIDDTMERYKAHLVAKGFNQ